MFEYQIITLAEVKAALRIDHTDDDVMLQALIDAATGAVVNYLKAQAEELIPIPSGSSEGDLIVTNPEIKQAAIILVGMWYRNPDGDQEKNFDRGYLPAPVTALLYPLRDPALA